MNSLIDLIIEMIDNQIESNIEDSKKIEDINCVAAGYCMGAIDELRYLKEQILEIK